MDKAGQMHLEITRTAGLTGTPLAATAAKMVDLWVRRRPDWNYLVRWVTGLNTFLSSMVESNPAWHRLKGPRDAFAPGGRTAGNREHYLPDDGLTIVVPQNGSLRTWR